MTVAISPPSETYWQWGDHAIHYVHTPSEPFSSVLRAKPPLLLVHGFGASTDHWRKNIADLSADFDVWAIDLLGFGRSAKPNIAYSTGVWRDQLHDFITHVIGHPVVIAGNSLGGYTGLCVAAQHSESISGLILLNSAGSFSNRLPTEPQPTWKRLWQTMVRQVLLHPVPAFFLFQYTRRRSVIRKTLMKVYLDPTTVTDQLVDDIYRPSCDPGAAQVFASVFKAKQGATIDELLADLRCPLLMLWGEGDPWMDTREKGAKFRKHYPALTEHYLQAGHCPHDEVPYEVNLKIRQWLELLG